MNCLRRATRPAKVQPPSKTSILEQALRKSNMMSSTESLDLNDVTAPPPALMSPLKPEKPAQATPAPAPAPAKTPAAETTPPQRPSHQFLELQRLRTLCNSSRTPCIHTFLKGPRKGEKCGASSAVCEVFCSKHLVKKPGCVSSTPSSTRESYKKLRVNRLKRGKRYFFIRKVGDHKVVVMCNGVHYILLLPLGMEHPECPSKRHYLIRNFSGHTQWKQAPKSITC